MSATGMSRLLCGSLKWSANKQLETISMRLQKQQQPRYINLHSFPAYQPQRTNIGIKMLPQRFSKARTPNFSRVGTLSQHTTKAMGTPHVSKIRSLHTQINMPPRGKFGKMSLFTNNARPPFGAVAGRRFIADMTVRHYVQGGPTRILGKLLTGKAFGRILRMIFGSLKAAMRLPVAILTAAIASLAYVEYKLSQLSAPNWMPGGLQQVRGWLEGIRDSEWIRGIASGSQSDDNDDNAKSSGIDKAMGSSGGWSNGRYSSSDPASGSGGNEGGGIPPPRGDYYTSPEPNSEEINDTISDNASAGNTKRAQPRQDNNENALMELTKRLLEIQTILKTIDNNSCDGSKRGSSLKLPSIVVIGSQSSGKSSVLESIVGREFLPKGNNMVTRRPIELTLINTANTDEEYGEFPQLGLDKVSDFRQIQRTLFDLNMSVPDSECVSDKPIELRIYSPHVPNLRLVDLPGYIQVVNRKQPPVLRQKIRDLCEGYLKQPNVILAVCAADVDLANSEALKASRRNDPLGMRTIGVITKVDMAEPDSAVHMLTQNEYPLHLGYIGVICKPVHEKAGKTSHEIVLSEAQYFTRHSEFHDSSVQVGVGTLRRKLVRVLEESMRRNLSNLVDAVRGELEETKYQIKVQYNDERVSPESYMAESLDTLKQRFKEFQNQFGKPQLRSEVQRWLENRVMDVCAELYWSDPAVAALSNHITRSRAAGWWADAKSKTSQAATAAAGVITELLVADTAKDPKTPKLSGPSTRKDGNGNGNGSKHHDRSSSVSNEWTEDNDLYWDHKLDSASALLTKSGVGRWTTQMVVNLLMENVAAMVDSEPFIHHPETRSAVLNFSNEILRSKYHTTVDQVENTIKPFKYEVEIEPHEWKKAVQRSRSLIDNEIRLCRQSLVNIRSSTPKKQLRQAVQFVQSAEKRGVDPLAIQIEIARRNSENATSSSLSDGPKDGSDGSDSKTVVSEGTDEFGYAQFSPPLIRRAQQILMVQDRLAVLSMRRKAICSSACASEENKRFCPEVFLDVVAEKLAYNAVMFINFELLHDFFFQFPRELDSHLYYGKSMEQTRNFASQNPRIGKQLSLLERREKLEIVMARLKDIALQQAAANMSSQNEFYDGGSGHNGSSSRNNTRYRAFPGL